MKLSISNIGWDKDHDEEMYQVLQGMGFSGLEIAPTRIFPEQPYDRLEEAGGFAEMLMNQYRLTISSMQSIWFGQNGSIFGAEDEKQALIDYTKKAIDFAEKIHCGNLVFGCPRNRNMPETDTDSEQRKLYASAVDFFTELAEYAATHNTVLAMEANPPIYNTNFINTTTQAYTLVTDVKSQLINKQGFGINLDVGTMIYNEEKVSDLRNMIQNNLISHTHISESFLKPIQERKLHQELIQELYANGYDKYISIEMGKQEDLKIVQDVMKYLLNISESCN